MFRQRLVCSLRPQVLRAPVTRSVLAVSRFQSTVPSATASSTSAPLSTDDDADIDNYPDVKPELYYYRDPDAKWDDPQNRRNFGQELNPDDDNLNMWSPQYYDTVSDSKALMLQLMFFGAVGAFSAVMYFFFYPQRVAVPRNYPGGLAKDLGAKDESDAYLYSVRVDKTY